MNRTYPRLLALALPLLLWFAAPGHAGIEELAPEAEDPVCVQECLDAIDAWVSQEMAGYAPTSTGDIQRFDVDEETCTTPHAEGPEVTAIVVAPFYNDFLHLPGTQNDAKLWEDLLRSRGVEPKKLHVLAGDAVKREDLVAAMRKTIPCMKDRDQLVFIFSGVSTSYVKWGFTDGETFLQRKCADPALDADIRAKVCTPELIEVAADAADTIATDYDEQMMLTSETSITSRDPEDTQLVEGDLLAGVTARELSNFAAQIQNRGADAIFIVDSSFAAEFGLVGLGQRVGSAKQWRWERDVEDPTPYANAGVVEIFGTGELAALYATRGAENAFETRRTGDIVLGELTFAVSEALRNMQNPTIEQLSHEVDRMMEEEESEQIPVFEATNPGLRFMAPRDDAKANPEQIQLISPRATRGAVAISAPQLDVVARYAGPGVAAFASIDGLNVDIGANGQFRRSVKLDNRTEIPIRVFGKDATVLAERSLMFGADAVKASLSPVGRKLALIIGNRAYADPMFPTLQTPIDDARAVQKALAEHFGFTTTLETAPGKTRDLLLTDATKMDILKALSDLRKYLTAEDQLVIFYAGHGVIDAEKSSYWVPIDATSEDYSWIRAFDITEELRKIASGSVLLISDSCYAGGLSRDAAPAKADESRDRYLAKSMRYKARQLIASGGNEPVADGGGNGHSLFAQALLDALGEMPETVFTANELFEDKIKPKVVSSAFATSAKGQTPVFYRITHAGDEPESEFVFVRN